MLSENLLAVSQVKKNRQERLWNILGTNMRHDEEERERKKSENRVSSEYLPFESPSDGTP